MLIPNVASAGGTAVAEDAETAGPSASDDHPTAAEEVVAMTEKTSKTSIPDPPDAPIIEDEVEEESEAETKDDEPSVGRTVEQIGELDAIDRSNHVPILRIVPLSRSALLLNHQQF